MLQLLKFIITKRKDLIKNPDLSRLFNSILIAFSFLTLILPSCSQAQIDDVGVWFGITLQTKITRQLEGSITEQLRFRNDATRINLLLSDIGFDYSVNKKLKVGFHYRFIKSNRGNYYSSRHRISADITWKEKIDFITITLRERIQEQFSDYYSIETGNIPVWVLRSKLTVKFDINKKYSPYLSGEIYYLLDNAVNAKGITRFRYETGINYDFNRVHSINPFIICQVARPVNFIELIYGISYTYSF